MIPARHDAITSSRLEIISIGACMMGKDSWDQSTLHVKISFPYPGVCVQCVGDGA